MRVSDSDNSKFQSHGWRSKNKRASREWGAESRGHQTEAFIGLSKFGSGHTACEVNLEHPKVGSQLF